MMVVRRDLPQLDDEPLFEDPELQHWFPLERRRLQRLTIQSDEPQFDPEHDDGTHEELRFGLMM